MTSESGTQRGAHPRTLLLGPGERLDEAFLYLRALHQGSSLEAPASGSSHLDQLEDLGGLFCDFEESGTLLLDCDFIDLQDVGLVRRFLEARPGWTLELTGGEPGRAAARALRSLGCSRWWPSPFELADLRDLSSAGSSQAPCPGTSAGALDSEPGEEHEDPLETELHRPIDEGVERARRDPADAALIAQVEAILGTPRGLRAPQPSAQDEAQEREPQGETTLKPEPGNGEAEPLRPAPPAPYFKDQVADLADLIQRLDLGLTRLHEQALEGEGPESRELTRRVDEVTGEVMRLKQFARTLSYLSAPPPPGQQRFELAPMLEELLGARRSEPGSPRYMLRSGSMLPVRSDKALLMQVFDALLYLCHQLAGEGATVRVDGRVEEDPTGVADRVKVSIRFPSSDHPELDPATVLTPYGLRRILPELGPNALAAAAGILRGQGGSLELLSESGAGFEWVLRLPLAR